MKRYLPILEWLPRYQRAWLWDDIVAGLAVSAVLVPTAMAYAGIAGVPPLVGLYSVPIPLILYAIFGSSRTMVVGPDSATVLNAYRTSRRGDVAVSRVCLDTSAYSQFKRGDQEVAEILDAASYVAVPAVVIGELWLGFLGGARTRENELELHQFLEHRVVEEVPVDREVARIYAEIVRTLKAKGTPLPTNDIWIAASAAHVGAMVLTFDDHFRAIERVGSRVLSANA